MLGNIGKWGLLSQKFLVVATNMRYMTTTEVSTALRPFYFSVHPDLFGQHPNQRSTNENSLKQLSCFIESVQTSKIVTPCSLQFYVRNKKKEDSFRLIQIYLYKRDMRATILTILKSCDLSTEYVDKIPESQAVKTETIEQIIRTKTTMNKKVDFSTLEDDPIFGAFVVKTKIKGVKDGVTLKNWLDKNINTVFVLSTKYKPLRDEVAKLKKTIAQQWELLDLRWECVWNEQHLRGCLQSFINMADQNPNPMHKLRGRVLVFGQFTGVNLDGDIMLNSGDVRHNWLDLIRNVTKYEAILSRIPAFERALSQVLLEIRITRRKFMPKVLAEDYERNLQQLTTNVSDYLGRQSYPIDWPKSLKDYEIVVESEAGPLMVSPTGQFITPATCPGSLLVKFMSEHMDEAAKSKAIYQRNKYIERTLYQECINELKLAVLYKDDNVTPDLMINCCEQLLKHKIHLVNLQGVNLTITNYYSVLKDGTVCIPWNWKL